MQEGQEKVVHVAKCAFDSGTNEGEVGMMSVNLVDVVWFVHDASSARASVHVRRPSWTTVRYTMDMTFPMGTCLKHWQRCESHGFQQSWLIQLLWIEFHLKLWDSCLGSVINHD